MKLSSIISTNCYYKSDSIYSSTRNVKASQSLRRRAKHKALLSFVGKREFQTTNRLMLKDLGRLNCLKTLSWTTRCKDSCKLLVPGRQYKFENDADSFGWSLCFLVIRKKKTHMRWRKTSRVWLYNVDLTRKIEFLMCLYWIIFFNKTKFSTHPYRCFHSLSLTRLCFSIRWIRRVCC